MWKWPTHCRTPVNDISTHDQDIKERQMNAKETRDAEANDDDTVL